MIKWQYSYWCSHVNDASGIMQELNKMGQDGWELASSYVDSRAIVNFVFKRPLP